MILPTILLIIGFVILIGGGDIFVKGSSSVAKKMKVSSLVIGLTIVSLGTSAPELAINIFSALKGASDIAIGNILGSNISNIFFVLGVAALINPLTIKNGTATKEVPLGVLSVLILFFLANDVLLDGGEVNVLSLSDGLILMSFFAIFAYYTYGMTKVEGENGNVKEYGWFLSFLMIVGGIFGLTVGGQLIVSNGIGLARSLGVSELFIGLTFTAIGTSLPELATSAIAAYRNHVDLAVGNVVGSNIFNILWVLGITSIIEPLELSPSVNTDIIITGAASIILFIAIYTGRKKHKYLLQSNNTVGILKKREGVFFLLIYICYILFLAVRG